MNDFSLFWPSALCFSALLVCLFIHNRVSQVCPTSPGRMPYSSLKHLVKYEGEEKPTS